MSTGNGEGSATGGIELLFVQAARQSAPAIRKLRHSILLDLYMGRLYRQRRNARKRAIVTPTATIALKGRRAETILPVV